MLEFDTLTNEELVQIFSHNSIEVYDLQERVLRRMTNSNSFTKEENEDLLKKLVKSSILIIDIQTVLLERLNSARNN